MRLHIVTVGQPKLPYAKAGWDEYLKRLQRFHTLQVTHIADKYAYDTNYLLKATGNSYKVALVIDGPQLSSPELADFLQRQAIQSRELYFVVGGPEGLPQDFIAQCDMQWGLSKLTFPHDLAMVVLLEALYRASTITAGHPYHK